MFSHTPDRCWTSVGWKLEQATPEFVDLTLHGIRLKLERRIFASGTHRELVTSARWWEDSRCPTGSIRT